MLWCVVELKIRIDIPLLGSVPAVLGSLGTDTSFSCCLPAVLFQLFKSQRWDASNTDTRGSASFLPGRNVIWHLPTYSLTGTFSDPLIWCIWDFCKYFFVCCKWRCIIWEMRVTCLIANDLGLLHSGVILWCPHPRNSTWLFVSLPSLGGNLIRLSGSAL